MGSGVGAPHLSHQTGGEQLLVISYQKRGLFLLVVTAALVCFKWPLFQVATELMPSLGMGMIE